MFRKYIEWKNMNFIRAKYVRIFKPAAAFLT